MKKQSFIFFTITYELNDFKNADYFLNIYINHDYDQWMERNLLPTIKFYYYLLTFFTTSQFLLHFTSYYYFTTL